MEALEYKQFIDNILNTRGRFGLPKDTYQEKHHILPRCQGGTDEKSNLIALSAEEHFRAHWLLAEENPDNLSLQYALYFTTIANKSTPNRYKPTEEERTYLKNLMSRVVSIDSSSRIVCYDKNTCEIKRLKPENITDDYIIGFPPEYVGPTKGVKMSQEQKDKLSKSKKGKYVGKKWFNNGVSEIIAYDCPEGYVAGRLEFSEEAKINMSIASKQPCSQETREKLSRIKTGLHCYNNGEINIRAKECPEGFKPGFIKKNIRYKFCTNDIITIKIKETDPIPEGFHLGMTKNTKLQNRRWFTNGVENRLCQECPEGFYLGRSKKFR